MKLSWYIIRHVLLMIGLVLLVIITVDFIFAMIADMGNIGQGNYTWWANFICVLLRMPTDICVIFPITVFLGSLISLMILSSKSELIVMRTSGMSIVDLAKTLLLSSSFLLIIYFALNAFIAPYTHRLATFEQNHFKNNQSILVLSEQTWLKAGNHFLLIGKILPDDDIEDVTDFKIDNGALAYVRHINNIHINKNNTWTGNQISTTTLSNQGVTQQQTDSMTEPSPINNSLLPALSMLPQEMTIVTLYNYIEYRKSNNLDVKTYDLQFWNLIFSPLMLPIMILLALPFAMGSQRSRTHLKIIAGIAIGFSFYIIGQFFGSLTILTPIPAFLGALLPSLIFGMILIILLKIMSR